ncbi:hypothetical protein HMI54_006539 [Coelomomyces lativittatus]|nr:hypothetical protein HMI56_007052 [Coelomomyces lativittatus]KAJ1513176.1 hypothetical protein HMI55_005833 [Coelomomyces lativittatus]KAJ1517218.1 hypothetical protein HMI54_006539 [Coelomomyces lativittatus]
MSDSYSFQTDKNERVFRSGSSSWDLRSSSYLHSSMNSSPQSGYTMNTLTDTFNPLDPDKSSDFKISTSAYLKYGMYRLLGLALWSHVNVATTLLRIQYLPNETTLKQFSNSSQKSHSIESLDDEMRRKKKEKEEEEDMNSSPETTILLNVLGSPLPSELSVSQKPATLDTEGYLLYTPFMDEKEGTKPPHRLPRLFGSHIWPTVKCIRDHSSEGVLGLYKGIFTDFTKQMLIETVEPSLSSTLYELFNLDDSLEPVDLDNPLPMTVVTLFSRMVVDWMVSPLEYTKARLILRSRKAPGTFSFFSIFRQLFPTCYTHPLYVLPTLTVSFLYHGLGLATPLLIDRGFGISSIYNPYQYALYECFCFISRDLVLLPFHTLQLRLGTQPADEWSVVDQSPVPYTGMWDCFKRMLLEERGKNLKLMRPFYKGFRITLWSHLFNFCVRITSEYMDWEAMFEDESF